MNMLTKDGNPVPAVLAEALEKDEFALKTFIEMRPICQNRYSERISSTKNPLLLDRRVKAVIEDISKYGCRAAE